eukprot:TRINITY_DN1390_c0_g1_i3.p1 TRINITY_DN1390_c0_g1~~TRINITY_DN1390_c0_g1_i3.p1  ORF type:complete len:168 (-),score=30.51 TRINITY_DN1390_c0_g1_i3:389-892(-)
MKCVAMILLAGVSLSQSSTDVQVSAHDPQSGLSYSYSITTVDTVPTLPPTTGYNTLPHNGYPYHTLAYAPAKEEGAEADSDTPIIPAFLGYPGYHPFAGLGYPGYPRTGYGYYQNLGYAGPLGYGGYPGYGNNPGYGYLGYPNLGYPVAGYDGRLAVPAALATKEEN